MKATTTFMSVLLMLTMWFQYPEEKRQEAETWVMAY